MMRHAVVTGTQVGDDTFVTAYLLSTSMSRSRRGGKEKNSQPPAWI